jgi:hypothetical protein
VVIILSYLTINQFLFLLHSQKVFKKIIYNRLYQHLSSNNILVSQQFGFRKNLSTTMATYNLLKEVLDTLNNNSLVGGIFCDLKKGIQLRESWHTSFKNGILWN